MGKLEEALTALERARKYNPKGWYPLPPLAVTNVQLGRIEEACKVLEPVIKRGMNLRRTMYQRPFKDREYERRFADALIKAGMPGEAGGYYKIREENRLSHKEINQLFLAQTVTGFDYWSGIQWWIERAKDGKASYRGPRGYVKGKPSVEISDAGKSWIEGDRLCNQWENLYGGYRDCFPVFKNPEGTPEKKDEYIGTASYGPVTFSPAD